MSLTGLLFLLFFASCCFFSLARHPIYGLMAYVGVFYLDPASRWWGYGFLGQTRWSLIAATVTLIGIAFHANSKVPKAFLKQPIIVAFLIFIVWLVIQLSWVYEPDLQLELLEIYAKYVLAAFIIYRTIETEEHLRWFLMAHVLGCVYLGLVAFGSYTTGRFDDFGGAGLKEANAVANQVVTAILAGASLFLAGGNKTRTTVFFGMPFLLNALVTTISRSGFLALLVGGSAFNLLTPKRFRTPVRVLSILGIVLFAIVAGPKYWERIQTIKERGQEIEGVDTGTSRVALIKVQVEMFEAHPWGCGHRCTAYLAPNYLDEKYRDPIERGGTRSSHNTFMSLAVEQGVVGIAFYLTMLTWAATAVLSMRRKLNEDQSFIATVYPAIASGLLAVFVGDMFVDYLRHEVRIWLITTMLVMFKLLAMREQSVPATTLAPSDRPKTSRNQGLPGSVSQPTQ